MLVSSNAGRGGVLPGWVLLLVALGCGDGPGPLEAAPSSALPSALEPAQVVDAVAGVPRPDDPMVLSLGTPESSRAARPPWAPGMVGYAPAASADVARALFEAAATSVRRGVSLHRDLLACRIEHDVDGSGANGRRRALAFGVTLRWGSAHHEIDGPRAGTPAHLAVPLVTLAPGDPWQVHLRDEGGVVEIEASFDGKSPLRAEAGGFAIECRPVEPAARAEAVRDALWDVDRRLVLLATTAGEAPPRSGENGEIEEIEEALRPFVDPASSVAALVGWDDPRLARRFERRAALEGKLLDRLAQGRAEALARAKAPGEWVGVGRMGRRLEVKVDALDCDLPAADDATWRCRATLSLDNGGRGDREVRLSHDSVDVGGAAIAFVDRFGRAAHVRWPEHADPVVLARSGMATFTVHLEPAAAPGHLQAPPPPGLPVALELQSERARHRIFRRKQRPTRSGRLPRPAVCGAPGAAQLCAGL